MKLSDLLNQQYLEPILTIQKQMEVISQRLDPFFTSLNLMNEKFRLSLEEIERTKLRMETISTHLFENINRQTQMFEEAANRWKRMVEPIQGIEEMSNLFQPFTRTLEQIQELSNTISLHTHPLTFPDAYEEILRHYQVSLESEVDDPIEAVAIEVEKKVQSYPGGPMSIEAYIQIVLALFIFIYSHISSIDSETRISSRLENLENFVSKSLEDLKSQRKKDTFYVVIRPVNLRPLPSVKSKVQEVLPQNLKVILLERKGKWIRIEYFDHVENLNKSGWVYKKYLKNLGQI